MLGVTTITDRYKLKVDFSNKDALENLILYRQPLICLGKMYIQYLLEIMSQGSNIYNGVRG